jgi:hypothetical protein
MYAPRRTVLDKLQLDAAPEAGAEVRTKLDGLVGVKREFNYRHGGAEDASLLRVAALPHGHHARVEQKRVRLNFRELMRCAAPPSLCRAVGRDAETGSTHCHG